ASERFSRMTFKIGLPHIGTDEDDLRGHLVANHGEESLKGFDRSLFSYPKQACNVEVDLINQRQVLVAFGVLDLINFDGVDLAERAVLQSERDDCSTASNTLPQDVRKASAVSFHDNRRAQRARKSM